MNFPLAKLILGCKFAYFLSWAQQIYKMLKSPAVTGTVFPHYLDYSEAIAQSIRVTWS
jgi:hypothetical protein